MQAKQRAIFQAITGRTHSGRTIHTIRKAMILANTPEDADEPIKVPSIDDIVYGAFEPRTVIVVCADIPQVRDCISMWKDQGNKIEFCRLGEYEYRENYDRNTNPSKVVVAIVADEMTLTPITLGQIGGLLETLYHLGIDTIIGLPALVGMKGDLKMTAESRGLLNHCPVGTEIFLTELLNTDGTFEDRCKIRRVGQTMPFKI